MKAIHLVKNQSLLSQRRLIILSNNQSLFSTHNNNNNNNTHNQGQNKGYPPRNKQYQQQQQQGSGNEPLKLNTFNQTKAYKADPKISLIIKSNASDDANAKEKDAFNRNIRECALGLYKNYKRTSKNTQQATDDFIVNISKNMDGRTFTLFIKYLNELRNDVLENQGHKLTPDSFLIFLDKVRNLTHASALNDLILRNMAGINIDELKAKKMLNIYQQKSFEFKFEENLRMGEIKQFASEVIPKPRFLFNSYQTQTTDYPQEQQDGTQATEPKSQETTHQPNEDYFSFFSSHEKVILKPESNFKNLRQFMEFLPIDYYILLQDGFQKEIEVPKSNHVFYSNFPLLVKKRSYTNQTIIKNITYEDIYRCLDKNEAQQLLVDMFAQEELTKHLEKQFGKLKDMFHINYNDMRMLVKFEKQLNDVKNDELQEFEETMMKHTSKNSKDFEPTGQEFEDILALANDDFAISEKQEEKNKGSKKGKPLKGGKTEFTEEVVENLRKKERKDLGLENQLGRSGFIIFEDYYSKLKMLNTPLFLFGMKLYRQQGHIEFFDADFCNSILVSCDQFQGQRLGECCKLINEYLLKSGFEDELLTVGKLQNIEDFDLSQIIVQKEFKITLRFNTFNNALKAFQLLTMTQDVTRNIKFKCLFQNPAPNYYDGKLATQFETCIKDKFEGLHHINEVDANYVKKQLEDFRAQQQLANQI